MSDHALYDYWFQELCKAKKRQPHSARECESIASSNPIALWFCPVCKQTYLALRHLGYTCHGGFRDPLHDPPLIYGTRRDTLRNLERITYHSDETGTEEAVSYHRAFISEFTRYK